MESESLIDMDDEVTKFCTSFVTRKVVEVGIRYAVSSWNSYPIPGNIDFRCYSSKFNGFLGHIYMINNCKKGSFTVVLEPDFNSFFVSGKGVPLQMSYMNSRTVGVNANQIPTVEQAVRMYQGCLNLSPSFGVDPLEREPAKKEARERQFLKYFTSFESV